MGTNLENHHVAEDGEPTCEVCLYFSKQCQSINTHFIQTTARETCKYHSDILAKETQINENVG